MSEKLCLQWNDYKDNVESAFGSLREDKEFNDVTLACEDGHQMEAHKVILSSLSPFFQKILQKNKHPHPLIYLKGFQSKDFMSILDFLYSGEANVYQEDLDSFLAIAEEIQLKGLTGQTPSALVEEQGDAPLSEPIDKSHVILKKPTTHRQDMIPNVNVQSKTSSVLEIPKNPRTDLQALDEKIKSMMEKGLNMILSGTNKCGKPKQTISWTCKVCGKEGHRHNIRDHIEVNHLEGISIPCDNCDKTFSSRAAFRQHKCHSDSNQIWPMFHHSWPFFALPSTFICTITSKCSFYFLIHVYRGEGVLWPFWRPYTT